MSKKITRIISGLWVDFVVTDDVQKPHCVFYSKVLGNGSTKPSILKAHFAPRHLTHLHDNYMSLQTKCARFRSVGTLLILGFITEDMLGLEASYRVAFAIAKERVQPGMTYQTLL